MKTGHPLLSHAVVAVAVLVSGSFRPRPSLLPLALRAGLESALIGTDSPSLSEGNRGHPIGGDRLPLRPTPIAMPLRHLPRPGPFIIDRLIRLHEADNSARVSDFLTAVQRQRVDADAAAAASSGGGAPFAAPMPAYRGAGLQIKDYELYSLTHSGPGAYLYLLSEGAGGGPEGMKGSPPLGGCGRR